METPRFCWSLAFQPLPLLPVNAACGEDARVFPYRRSRLWQNCHAAAADPGRRRRNRRGSLARRLYGSGMRLAAFPEHDEGASSLSVTRPSLSEFFEALVRVPVRGYHLTFAPPTFRELSPVSARFHSGPVRRENFESPSLGFRFPGCCEGSVDGSLSECLFSVFSFWRISPPLKRTLLLFRKNATAKFGNFRCKNRAILCKRRVGD